MKTKSDFKGLYVITRDDNFLLQKIEIALLAGAKVIQFRDKNLVAHDSLRIALKLKELCSLYRAFFIINDDVDLAVKSAADGVHIGKDDVNIRVARNRLPDKIIGVSCYNDINLAIKAQQQGADYVAFGRFFVSRTKPNAVPADKALLLAAQEKIVIPIVAIGGITPDNGKELIATGVDMLAVIDGIFGAADTQKAALAYVNLFKRK